jgi:hypothetical protein
LYNRWLAGSHDVQYRELNKHGTCAEIPNECEPEAIFSIIRDPFDRYVSSYYFGWWRRYPEDYVSSTARLKNRWPSFPDLSFEEFVQACCEEFEALSRPGTEFMREFGWYSRNVVMYYFQQPRQVIPKIDDSYLKEQRWKDDIYEVTFLHTEDLNRELFEFLKHVGYPTDTLSFVQDLGRVRPKDQAEDRGNAEAANLFTPDLVDYVVDQEQLFFELFPEYKTTNALEVSVV